MARGDGRLWPRGDIWYFAGQERGKEKRMPTGVRVDHSGPRDANGKLIPPRAAELFRLKKLEEIRQSVPVRSDRLTFKTIIDNLEAHYVKVGEPSMIEASGYRLRPLRKAFLGSRVSELTMDVLKDYCDRRIKTDKKAPGTVRQEMTFLHRAFSLAFEKGLMVYVPPVPLPKAPPRKDKGTLPDDGLGRIAWKMAPHYRAPLWFLRLSGWRRGEAVGLEWSEVLWQEKRVVLMPTGTVKRKVYREVSWVDSPQLEELLLSQRAHCDELGRKLGFEIKWVFPTRRGRQMHGDTFFGAWIKARRESGVMVQLRDKSTRLPLVHDIRRQVSTVAHFAGMSRIACKAMMGHVTDQMSDQYVQVPQEEMDKACGQLAKATPDRLVPLQESAQ